MLTLPRSQFSKFTALANVLLPALRRSDARLCERLASYSPEEEDALERITHMHASGAGRQLAVHASSCGSLVAALGGSPSHSCVAGAAARVVGAADAGF